MIQLAFIRKRKGCFQKGFGKFATEGFSLCEICLSAQFTSNFKNFVDQSTLKKPFQFRIYNGIFFYFLLAQKVAKKQGFILSFPPSVGIFFACGFRP
jgi:hypothetical protein